MKYVFGGTARYVGRFGFLKPGDIIDLTPEEADAVATNLQFGKVPQPSEVEEVRTAKRLTVSSVLSSSDDRNIFDVVKGAPAITISLPTAPIARAGWNVVIRHSIESTDINPITIDTVGAETIDGANFLNLEQFSARYFYYDGANFKTVAYSG